MGSKMASNTVTHSRGTSLWHLVALTHRFIRCLESAEPLTVKTRVREIDLEAPGRHLWEDVLYSK